ncbi:MAG TPA: hypothetical protein VM050_05730 [Patescibacteria group bacterium]|nr:hypothetical protein [Patescibacteria group bacterium]
MDEEKLRLAKLIEHWAHHNEEHRKRFAETVAEAERLALDGVAEEMRLAAYEAGEVSKHLLKALKHLEERDG